MSTLCAQYFNRGIANAVLFVDAANIPAQRLYETIGFFPAEKFVIEKYNTANE